MTVETPADPAIDEPGRVRGYLRRLNSGDAEGLAGDTAWSIATDGAFVVVMTISFLVIGRHLGPTTYGYYVATYGIIGPIGCITMSGVTLAVIQRAVRDGDEPTTVLRSGLTLCAGLGLIGTVAATALAWVVTKGEIALVSIVFLVSSELVFAASITVCTAAVQSTHGFARASKYRILLAPAKLIMILTLLATGSVSVPGVAVGSIVLYAGFATVMLAFVMPRLSLPPAVGRPSRELTRTALMLGFPISAASIQSDGDKSVLSHFGFARDAGLYGAATRVMSLALVPLRALDSAAFMRFLKFDAGATGQHVRRAKRYCVFALAMNLLLAAFLFVAAPHFSLILGDEFEGSETMIRWLLLYLPFLAISGAPLNGLLGLGKVGHRAVISTVSAGLSLALYLTLIPSMSWKGAIVGTVIGEAFLAVVGWTVLYREQARHDATVGDEPSFADTFPDPDPRESVPHDIVS